MITPLERFIQISKRDGVPSDRLSEFLEAMTRQVNLNTTLIGSGSPEGVVTASITQKYMDTAGTAGNILYIKKTGSGNTGWILV